MGLFDELYEEADERRSVGVSCEQYILARLCERVEKLEAELKRRDEERTQAKEYNMALAGGASRERLQRIADLPAFERMVGRCARKPAEPFNIHEVIVLGAREKVEIKDGSSRPISAAYQAPPAKPAERVCGQCSKTCDVGVPCWWCGAL